jgi:hypothetical protein
MDRVQGRRETRAFQEEAALSIQELGGLPEGSRGRKGTQNFGILPHPLTCTTVKKNHLGSNNVLLSMIPIAMQGSPFIPSNVCQGAYSKGTIASIRRPGEFYINRTFGYPRLPMVY